jgi:hypothetical protein
VAATKAAAVAVNRLVVAVGVVDPLVAAVNRLVVAVVAAVVAGLLVAAVNRLHHLHLLHLLVAVVAVGLLHPQLHLVAVAAVNPGKNKK